MLELNMTALLSDLDPAFRFKSAYDGAAVHFECVSLHTVAIKPCPKTALVIERTKTASELLKEVSEADQNALRHARP